MARWRAHTRVLRSTMYRPDSATTTGCGTEKTAFDGRSSQRRQNSAGGRSRSVLAFEGAVGMDPVCEWRRGRDGRGSVSYSTERNVVVVSKCSRAEIGISSMGESHSRRAVVVCLRCARSLESTNVQRRSVPTRKVRASHDKDNVSSTELEEPGTMIALQRSILWNPITKR